MDGGKVTALRATTAQPVTAGFMCAKMGRYPDRVNGSDRILTPLIRRGPKGSGSFEPASWDAALGEIVTRFRDVIGRHGGEAILPYHYDGSNGVFAHDLVDEALWRRLGASRLGRTLCAAPATEAATAVYGKMAGVAFPDYVHARAIVVWGANPGESNIHLVPHLNEARKRGARLVVIDPRRSQIAHHADLHLAVWPGSDLAVALWLIGEVDRRGKVATAFLEAHTRNAPLLLDEARRVTIDDAAAKARVAPRDLELLADLYLEADPALIRIGWGLERNRNGDGAMAAILAIPAIAGKFGVRGGGYTLSNSGAYRTKSDEMLSTPAPNPPTRLVNMTELGRILDPSFAPPIKALFVYDATRWSRLRTRKRSAAASCATTCSSRRSTRSSPTRAASPTSCFPRRRSSSSTSCTGIRSDGRQRIGPRRRRAARRVRTRPCSRTSRPGSDSPGPTSIRAPRRS